MSKPLVSVIVLTYNHSAFLSDAIESICTQKTSFDFEILVGDDASTDSTQQILKTFETKYSNLLNITYRTQNIGVVPNFVDTLKKAKGKYIAFCEGDDYWIDENKLQKQVDFLQANNNFAICFHTAKIFDQNKQLLLEDNITNSQKSEYSLMDLMKGNFLHTPTVMLRNDFVLKANFTELPIGDWPLYITMLKDRKIKKMEDAMAVYRVHQNSVWSSKSQIHRLQKTIQTINYLLKNTSLDQSHRKVLIKTMKKFKRKVFKIKYPLKKTLKYFFKRYLMSS